MTTYAEVHQLLAEPDAHDVADAPAGLPPHEVETLVEEMAALSQGLFGLLGHVLGGSPAAASGTSDATGLPVDPHPAAPVEVPAEVPAPVLRSVEMPVAVPTAAAVPPASVPMPEPVAETVSVPLRSVPMPDAAAVPPSIPMPDAGRSAAPIPVPARRERTHPALAAALLDEISFLDD